MLIRTQGIAREQGTRDGFDQAHFLIIGNAEYRQAMMTERENLVGFLARKNVGQMADAEAHLGTESSGQEFAGDLGRIDR
jgi:hypothetical protein